MSHDMPRGAGTMLDRLVWQKDRVLLDDLVFRIQDATNDDWELGNQCFVLYKEKGTIDLYASLLTTRPSFHPENILELGIWDGGSVAFWFEYFRPKKHVAVDISVRGDSDYFRHYVAANGLNNAIATFWGVDQADRRRLSEIVRQEFSGPLDLVIDDASHLYHPTKTSFEVLFPLLRPGGLYVVEDWNWEHAPRFQSPDHPWAHEISPTMLVNQLAAATGGPSGLIASLGIYSGLLAVERGCIDDTSLLPFSIERFVSHRPHLAAARPVPDTKASRSARTDAATADVMRVLVACTEELLHSRWGDRAKTCWRVGRRLAGRLRRAWTTARATGH